MKHVSIRYDDIIDIKKRSVKFQIGQRTVWLPKKCSVIDQVNKSVTIPEWLAMKEHLNLYASAEIKTC